MMEETIKKVGRGKKQSFFKELWRRLKKNVSAVVALLIVVVFIIIALSAGIIAPYSQAISTDISKRLQTPSSEHWFGTDEFGRDVFMRVIYGARISMFIGLIVAGFSLLVGGVLGAVSAYYGGLIDNIIMRCMDMLTSLPSTLLAMCVVAALGASMTNLLIALTISYIPTMTRIVRSSLLPVTEMEFVEAARACGTRDARIIFRHILPNGVGPVIVQTTRIISGTILSAAGLSYIGLGVQSPTPEWGSMLTAAREYMRLYPYLMIFPGVALVTAALSFDLLGDGFRDALDPRLKD
jgi:peptide/nickel transport system permease protein